MTAEELELGRDHVPHGHRWHGVVGQHQPDLNMASTCAQAADGVLTGGNAAQRVERHPGTSTGELAHRGDDVDLSGIQGGDGADGAGQLERCR